MTANTCRSLISGSVLCVLATLGFLLVIASSTAQGPPKAVVSPKIVVPPEFVEAEAVVKSQDDVGAKLIIILTDVKRPKSVRVEAARWLGKLRYAPAIPALIQHITLYDPEGPAEDGPVFPCQSALTRCGDAAVPSLVDAYLEGDNIIGLDRIDVSRLDSLSMAIAQKSRPAAWTYAKGIEATHPNPDQRFKTLIDGLLLDLKPMVKPVGQKGKP